MKIYIIKIAVLLLSCFLNINAQDKENRVWNDRQCAVALTYDDGLNIDLDNVIPVLDSLGFKGTFYIPGYSPVLDNRMEEWRAAADEGHELGNHTLFHPCAGKTKGRDWVKDDYNLNNYSINRIVREIRMANTLLRAVDGKAIRTFAYTCGDNAVGDSVFTPLIEGDFVAARGVRAGMNKIDQVDLYNIDSYMINGETGDELIDLVKKARANNALLVFLFHGVGGEHSINVSSEAHNKLLNYLKSNEKDIWVAPLVEIGTYVKEYREEKASEQN